jgi:hypothetical protein
LGKDLAIAGFLHRVPELQRANDPDPRIARGEYIAMTTCNECHGFSLRADVPWGSTDAPDLPIVMAYDEEVADLYAFLRDMGARASGSSAAAAH